MTWLLGIGQAALSFLSGLVGDLIRWVAVFFAYRLGKSKVREQMAHEANKRARDAQEIDEGVRRLSTSDLDKQLRDDL